MLVLNVMETVEECIIAYQNMSTRVFNLDEVLCNTVPFGDDQCRFNYQNLENVVKEIVRDRLGNENENASMSASTNKPSCRTFVVAKLGDAGNAAPILFR